MGRGTEEALGVQDNQSKTGLGGCPHPDCAGGGGGGGGEHLLPVEQHVIKRVGFAIPGVAKDGKDLDAGGGIAATAQLLKEMLLITNLGGGRGEKRVQDNT